MRVLCLELKAIGTHWKRRNDDVLVGGEFSFVERRIILVSISSADAIGAAYGQLLMVGVVGFHFGLNWLGGVVRCGTVIGETESALRYGCVERRSVGFAREVGDIGFQLVTYDAIQRCVQFVFFDAECHIGISFIVGSKLAAIDFLPIG